MYDTQYRTIYPYNLLSSLIHIHTADAGSYIRKELRIYILMASLYIYIYIGLPLFILLMASLYSIYDQFTICTQATRASNYM